MIGFDYNQVTPRGNNIIVEHEDYERKVGSIYLTEKLTGQEEIGFASGKILKIGNKVLDFVNLGRDVLLTEEDLLNKKAIYRQHLKNAWRLTKLDNGVTISMVRIEDVVGLVDMDVKVTAL